MQHIMKNDEPREIDKDQVNEMTGLLVFTIQKLVSIDPTIESKIK